MLSTLVGLIVKFLIYMKAKSILFIFLLSTIPTMALNCSLSCTQYFPNSTQYYTYTWTQTGTTCRLPSSGNVNYSISGKLKGSNKVLFIDSGECHVNDVVC
ncbi:MAG: hypothetical protein RLZZ469_594 [Bacteroidota bacterium]|jgi:hypothetical protein